MRQSFPPFTKLIQAIVAGEIGSVVQLLKSHPELAVMPLQAGATRQAASTFFLRPISHHVYEGDTALHVAAAAFQPGVAERLIRAGADCRTRNRRGAEPLHYAADTNHWAPAAQRATIECLLSAGADPNARDKSGVAPLHRAVRTRSSSAVSALLAGGADAQLKNHNGSTPLQIALRTTGRSGSGSARARSEQRLIVSILLAAGADRAAIEGAL